jgi:hypothetical protein
MMIEFKPDKYAAYEKIMKVIASCKTKEHLKGAVHMVTMFENTFNQTIKNKEMIKDLYSHLSIKKAILNG